MRDDTSNARRFGFDPIGEAWARGVRRRFIGSRARRHGHGGFAQTERGSVKYDLLAILADGPRHGYEMMLEIEERRGFRPSPGSIYPALQMLADGDFVTSREVDGKRVYSISDKGRELLQTRRDATEEEGDAEPALGTELMMRGMRTLHGLKDAVKQIARSGDVTVIGKAVDILDRARRELYALLADEK